MADGVRLARVYDPPDPSRDGARILVDRLWPRGIRKDALRLDAWCKDVAPSTELRAWYGHEPARFEEFAARYRAELAEPARAALVEDLAARARTDGVTLLTASRALEISQAAVLARVLAERR